MTLISVLCKSSIKIILMSAYFYFLRGACKFGLYENIIFWDNTALEV
jgi:hypothetical protein